jgi:hypothetical protein
MARRDLARQRLRDPGQVGIEEIEQGASGELGHAAATVGQGGVSELERTPVQALDERDPAIAEERTQQSAREMSAEMLRVGIEEADDLSGEDGQRAPHGVSLAEHRSQLRPQIMLAVDLRAQVPRDPAGGVGGRIDDDDLIDDAGVAQRGQRANDGADRALLVASRETDRDRLTALGRKPGRREVGVVEGVAPVPGACAHRHVRAGA